MGAAAVNSFKSVFQYTTSITHDYMLSYLIIFSLFVAFFSLLFIFYFGSERLLDTRYLDIRRIYPPSQLVLLFDMLSLGVLAALFVVLSDTIPSQQQTDISADILNIKSSFVGVIILIFLVDLITILLQFVVWPLDANERIVDDTSARTRIDWAIINAVSIITFTPFFFAKMASGN
jgi:hypothetical protein